MRLLRLVFPLLLATLASGANAAGPAAPADAFQRILTAKLEAELQKISQEFEGVYGVQVIDLTAGTRIGVNAELVFPQASAIKVAVLVELFRQAEARPALLHQRRPVTAAVKTGGSGVIELFGDGTSELALEDLAVLMIVGGDNTAANMLIDELGMERINRTMAELGLAHTRVQRKMIRPEASARGEENISTPAEAATLMARIGKCDLPISAQSCKRLREILESSRPSPGVLREAVPNDVPVAFKTGGTEGVTTTWARVDLPDRPYVLTVMTAFTGPANVDSNAAIRRTSEVVYSHFLRLARATGYGARVPLDVIRSIREKPAPK